MRSFEGKNMQTQYNVLSYRIDLYFHAYKFAIEINEHGQTDQEIKRQKTVEQELGFAFIKSDPDKEDFDILEL